MADLCGPCAAASLAWLDYRLPPPPVQLITIGEHRGVQRIAEWQEARYRDWRDTVNFQRDLIARLCAGGRHAEGRSLPGHVEDVTVGGLL